MVRSLLIIISIWCLFPVVSSAENPNPSVLMFDFSQNNNTYNWTNNYGKHFDFGRLQCDLNINANSMLLKKPYKRWQEQLSAMFSAEYRIFEGFSLAPYINHTRSALQARKVYTSELKLAAPLRKFKYAEFVPFVANRAIKREGQEPSGVDRGMGLGISGSSIPIKVLGNNIQAITSYEYYDLNKIPFSKFDLGFSGYRAFRESDSLSWHVEDIESITRYYDKIKSPQYVEDSILVVRQVKINRRAEGVARIGLPREVVARASGDLSILRYHYNRGGSAASLAQSDNYTKGRNYDIGLEKVILDRVKISTGYKYSWGEEDYRGSVLDQWMEMGEISFNLSSKLSTMDSLFFDGIIGLTSYYGLHGSTQRDRDVRTRIFNFRLKRLFSRYFNSEIRFAFSSFHQIYISGLNSASNNRNDTYLIQSLFGYEPFEKVAVNQIFSIQANYIVYDYDPNPLETPNRIFRRASTETKFMFRVSDRLDLMPGYTYRYEDYGKLIYSDDNWQMATGWDRRYHSLNIELAYRPLDDFLIEPAYTYELKKEYNHVLQGTSSPLEEDRIIREERLYDTKEIAAIRVTWNLGKNEYLDFHYSRRNWDVRDRDEDISEFVNVSVRYIF